MSLFHATLTDFEPPEKTVLNIQSKNQNKLITSPILSFLNWNIGFAGLGAKSNFFYDSNQSFFFSDGKMVRSPEAFVDENLKGIIDFIQSNPTDFVLLQEVDRSSKRSYYRNQHDLISAKIKWVLTTFCIQLSSSSGDYTVIQSMECIRSGGQWIE